MNRIEGVQIWAEKWRALRAWGRPLVEVDVTVRLRQGTCSTGMTWPLLREVVVRAGHDLPDALATVLHEYAHAAVPATEGHGEWWARRYAAAVIEVTGRPMPDTLAREDEKREQHDSLIDYVARDALRAWWREAGWDRIWALAKNAPRGSGR